jgi:hypothetical protein
MFKSSLRHWQPFQISYSSIANQCSLYDVKITAATSSCSDKDSLMHSHRMILLKINEPPSLLKPFELYQNSARSIAMDSILKKVSLCLVIFTNKNILGFKTTACVTIQTNIIQYTVLYVQKFTILILASNVAG